MLSINPWAGPGGSKWGGANTVKFLKVPILEFKKKAHFLEWEAVIYEAFLNDKIEIETMMIVVGAGEMKQLT